MSIIKGYKVKYSYLLNFLSIIFCGYFAQQSAICIGYAILFVLGLIVLRFVFKSKAAATNYYALFFFIYSMLVVVTHMELIHNPATDYYMHNDASESFYTSVVNYILPCNWNEVFDRTIINPLFSHYPLSAFLFGMQAKLGSILDITNLRLFLRLHSVLMGSMVVGIIANLLSQYKFSAKDIRNLILPLGLCTYLFITSAIFSRDVDVCLAYTIGAYICLSPGIINKAPYFIVVFLLALGFRPESGLVFLVFPFMYYYNRIKNKTGMFGIIFLFIIVLAFFIPSSLFKDNAESLKYYNSLAQNNTGGLFEFFYNLPFPLNTIILVAYMFIMPVPIQGVLIGEHASWANLTYVMSPYIIVQMLCICYFALISKDTDKNVKMLIIASIIAFTAITYGSPDLRRAYAAVPALYMCFCLYNRKLRKIARHLIKVGWCIVFVITVFLSLYVI